MIVGLASLALALVIASCRTPTQVTLVMSTDLACTQTKGLAITGAGVGRSERAAPNTISYRCEGAGDLGTLVVTPAAEKDGDVSFRLVIGVDAPAEQCLPPDYKGCIVQRRILSYLPHTELELPIRMLLVCKDVPCDESSTCAASGRCVSARISDPEDCIPPRRCFPLGDPSGEPGGEDDAGRDASADSDGSDGATSDGSPTDASSDASGGGDSSVGGYRYCPPQQTCVGTCCWDKSADQGTCSPGSCAPAEVPLSCTRKSDCFMGFSCCTDRPAFTTAYCSASCADYLCMTSADCPANLPTCGKGASTLSPPNGVFGLCQ